MTSRDRKWQRKRERNSERKTAERQGRERWEWYNKHFRIVIKCEHIIDKIKLETENWLLAKLDSS